MTREEGWFFFFFLLFHCLNSWKRLGNSNLYIDFIYIFGKLWKVYLFYTFVCVCVYTLIDTDIHTHIHTHTHTHTYIHTYTHTHTHVHTYIHTHTEQKSSSLSLSWRNNSSLSPLSPPTLPLRLQPGLGLLYGFLPPLLDAAQPARACAVRCMGRLVSKP